MQRYAVIGLGQFGSRIALRLAELGAEVLAMDTEAPAIEAVRSRVSQAIELDATDENAFQASGVDEVDVAIVAVGRNIEVSILVVAQLVRLAIPHIVARASSGLHAQILNLIGAHEISNPEQEMGERIAQNLIQPEIHDRVLLPSGHEWVEIDAPERFVGKAVKDLALSGHGSGTLIGIKRHEPQVTAEGKSVYQTTVLTEPAPEEVIQEGDRLALIGTSDQLLEVMRLG